MIKLHIYLRGDLVIIPMLAKVRGIGCHTYTEPVFTGNKKDVIAVAKGICEKLGIETPMIDKIADQVLLKAAKVTSYKTFQKGTFLWCLSKRDGGYSFGVVPKRSSGGWEGEARDGQKFARDLQDMKIATLIAEAIAGFEAPKAI